MRKITCVFILCISCLMLSAQNAGIGTNTPHASSMLDEGLSAVPEVYDGNVTAGTGGWAEVMMSIANATTSGASLYVHNPMGSSISPNFTIKVIAIGAQ